MKLVDIQFLKKSKKNFKKSILNINFNVKKIYYIKN